jgi:hypothetical protein
MSSNPGNDIDPAAHVVDSTLPVDGANPIAGGRTVPTRHANEWISNGFRLFGKSPGQWIVISIVMIVGSCLPTLIPTIGGLVLSLLMPGITAGILMGCRSLDSGDKLRVSHLLAAFKDKSGPLLKLGVMLLIASLVIGIAMAIAGVAMLGRSILQLPDDPQAIALWIVEQDLKILLLWLLLGASLFTLLAMAFWFAPALVAFHDVPVLSAAKESFVGCVRNALPFLLYGIVLCVLLVLAIVPIGLGLLVLIPVIYTSLYFSYKDIYLAK